MNHLGIDVGKRKCRTVLKDDKGMILDEFFFGNDNNVILYLVSAANPNRTHHTTAITQRVVESTGNLWTGAHDMLE